MAKQIGVSRHVYRRLKIKESQGRLTVQRLKVIAEALECDFVCVVVPKDSSKLWANARSQLAQRKKLAKQHSRLL